MKGSYTVEASIYVPMMMFLIMQVLQYGLAFYQLSAQKESWLGKNELDIVAEFYTYQMLEEIGKEWSDD